jgi:hypothetical protein
MANPTLPTTGTTSWVNDVNNWRANDAHWLQSRSILRFIGIDAVGDRNTALGALPGSFSSEGTISYVRVGSTGSFTARPGTTPADDVKIFLANFLSLSTDQPATVNLKHRDGAVGVSSISGLSSSQNFRIGPVTFTNTQLNIADSGGATVTLIKEASAAGGYLRVAGHFAVSQDTKLEGMLNVLGVSTLASLVVNGAAEVKGTLTASGSSSEIVSPTFRGNLIGNVTAVTVGVGSTGLNLTGNTLANGTNNVGVSSTTGIVLKTSGTMRARIDDGSTFPAPVASVIVQSGPPPAAPNDDYPDGCIWVQV